MYIETKTKFCHLKIFTCKGTVRQEFIWLAPRIRIFLASYLSAGFGRFIQAPIPASHWLEVYADGN
jgi:hypothetical protein